MPRTLIDYRGTYGGPQSRDEIVRALKEALALVEDTPRGAHLTCAGIRIEVLAGAPPRGSDRRSS